MSTMLRLRLVLCLLIACFGLVSGQTSWSPEKGASEQLADNEALKQIKQRDQAVRSATSTKDPHAGNETDEETNVPTQAQREQQLQGLNRQLSSQASKP